MTGPPNAEGFLLLTIPNAKLTASFLRPAEQVGVLSLECVTINVPSAENPFNDGNQRDVWLVLRLNNFELPIPATDTIHHSRSKNTFIFQSPDGTITIVLPPAMTPAAAEDLESLEVILAQYGILQSTDPEKPNTQFGDGDMKGRLVLVDEDDGNVVGTLGEGYSVKEDPNVWEPGREKDPIVVELPQDGQQEIRVHSVTPEEHDFILKSALFVSRGIVVATDLLAKGMAMGAQYYVQNTTPNAQPVVFSEATQANVRRIHHISGQAVKVTSTTTGLIHSMVDRLADRLGGKGKASGSGAPHLPHRSAAYAPGNGPGSPPSLPRRDKSGLGSGRASPSSGYRSTVPGAPGAPPPLPPRKPRLLNRLLISTDLLLTTLENSASTLATHATHNASTALGHKYGKDAGEAARLVGTTARNVGVVYIDARGVGRRALIKKVGKKAVRGRLGRNEVVFGEQINPDGTFSEYQDPWTQPGSAPMASPLPSLATGKGSVSRAPTYDSYVPKKKG